MVVNKIADTKTKICLVTKILVVIFFLDRLFDRSGSTNFCGHVVFLFHITTSTIMTSVKQKLKDEWNRIKLEHLDENGRIIIYSITSMTKKKARNSKQQSRKNVVVVLPEQYNYDDTSFEFSMFDCYEIDLASLKKITVYVLEFVPDRFEIDSFLELDGGCLMVVEKYNINAHYLLAEPTWTYPKISLCGGDDDKYTEIPGTLKFGQCQIDFVSGMCLKFDKEDEVNVFSVSSIRWVDQ
jgi:hypothetical protein